MKHLLLLPLLFFVGWYVPQNYCDTPTLNINDYTLSTDDYRSAVKIIGKICWNHEAFRGYKKADKNDSKLAPYRWMRRTPAYGS